LTRGLLAPLLALPALAGPAAQQDVADFNDLHLRATVISPWPANLSEGYMPLFVELENDSARERVVEIEARARSWGDVEHLVTRVVRVGPGERFRRELTLPAFGLDGGGYGVLFRTGGERRFAYPSGGIYGGAADVDPILLLRNEDPPQAVVDGWTQAVARREHDRGGNKTYDVSLAVVPPAEAARRYDAYTSLHAVVVDTHDVEASQVPEAVVTWARLGGTLAFLGPNAERVAGDVPGLAGWMEARFQLDPEELEGTVFTCGHGLLVVGEEREFLGARDVGTLQRAMDRNPSYAPGSYNQPSFLRDLPIPGLKDVPYRFFILFLFGFAVLIGPVNFLLVKSTGRPAWLLLTIPMIALLTSASILAYGVFYQGIELKEAEETYTLLDQREHLADTIEVRCFFAGLAPTDGLRPGPATACLPFRYDRGESDSLFLLDDRQGTVLSGEFLPVRREGSQVVLSERAARGRLALERMSAEVLRCENGLGAPIEALAVRGADGWTYAWEKAEDEAPIPPGGSVELVRAELSLTDRITAWMPKPIEGRDLTWSDGLPHSTYVARVSANPFADDAGLVPEVSVGQHVVLGVLARDEEDWQ